MCFTGVLSPFAFGGSGKKHERLEEWYECNGKLTVNTVTMRKGDASHTPTFTVHTVCGWR